MNLFRLKYLSRTIIVCMTMSVVTATNQISAQKQVIEAARNFIGPIIYDSAADKITQYFLREIAKPNIFELPQLPLQSETTVDDYLWNSPSHVCINPPIEDSYPERMFYQDYFKYLSDHLPYWPILLDSAKMSILTSSPFNPIPVRTPGDSAEYHSSKLSNIQVQSLLRYVKIYRGQLALARELSESNQPLQICCSAIQVRKNLTSEQRKAITEIIFCLYDYRLLNRERYSTMFLLAKEYEGLFPADDPDYHELMNLLSGLINKTDNDGRLQHHIGGKVSCADD